MPSITSPRRRSPSAQLHQQASLASERTRREKRLYEASLGGCVESLAQLLQEDRLILARASVTCFDETPLHVACMLGHVPFAKALLAHKRDLAMELDSQGRTPLHLAFANGYVEIARELLQLEPRACLVHDEDGRTPLHLATMKGRINIVKELVKASPEVVRYGDLVNAQDDEGNTILHLAAANKQIETVKCLLQRSEVDVNIENRNGFSPLDIVEYFPKDFKVIVLRELLVHAGALRAIRFPASTTHQAIVDKTNEENSTVVVDLASVAPPSTNTPPVKAFPPESFSGDISKQKEDKHEERIEKMRNSLMITATVIAAMAYQAGISPPCGVWDDDKKDKQDKILYLAGTSIMAANDPKGYSVFLTYNTISFLASLSTIFLLISGFPLGKKVLTRILMATMWVTIIFTALTYLRSMLAFSHGHRKPEDATQAPAKAPTHRMPSDSIPLAVPFMFVFLCAVAILFLFHTVRYVRKIRKSSRIGHQDV
ncbi:ankyrin repeat-containing protein NPR4 [Eucalyptus grandis]|uniref:ankyrin repeat-containing protein NPR4 n=1 Tax=Eucalyptus grandis TaxID=71139 RepID=UPI00192EB932|nr:ankyrin repeat-containing protein NPR4 [Eucalyptus grandis]